MSSRQAEEAFGGVAGLPSTFILDRQGRVYKSYVGQVEPETVEKDVKALLAAR
jgi:peroxiredoxin